MGDEAEDLALSGVRIIAIEQSRRSWRPVGASSEGTRKAADDQACGVRSRRTLEVSRLRDSSTRARPCCDAKSS